MFWTWVSSKTEIILSCHTIFFFLICDHNYLVNYWRSLEGGFRESSVAKQLYFQRVQLMLKKTRSLLLLVLFNIKSVLNIRSFLCVYASSTRTQCLSCSQSLPQSSLAVCCQQAFQGNYVAIQLRPPLKDESFKRRKISKHHLRCGVW